MTGSYPNKIAAMTGGVIVTLLLAALVTWASFKPRFLEPIKTITVTVSHTDGSARADTFETNAQLLPDALEPLGLFGWEVREDGQYVLTVDGEGVENPETDKWGYNVNGVPGELPYEEQPVADGDTFAYYIISEAAEEDETNDAG